MADRKKDGAQWLRRTVNRAHSQQLRATVATSLHKVSHIPGQLSGRAAGILTRKDARTVRIRLTLTTLAVTLLAVLVAGVGNYLSLPRTPEESVDRYLTSLKDGNYVSALDSGAYNTFAHTYLTNAIYRGAENRVDDYTITGIHQDAGGGVSADVLVSSGGQEQPITLNLTQVPRTGPFNDTWKLTNPAQTTLTLNAPVALTSVQINGSSLDLPTTRRTETDSGYFWSIPTLPGTYTFTLPETSYYTLAHTKHAVTAPLPGHGNPTQELTLDLRPSPRMWNETNDLITSWLDRCAGSRRLDMADCPTSALHSEDSTVTISNVTWELTYRPAFYLVQDRHDPSVWRAARDRPAIFEVTYLADGKAQRETIPFYINAQVVSNGFQADISVGLDGSEETEEQLRETLNSETSAQPTLQKFTVPR